MKRKVVFILGPTGSGKTSLAVQLAKKFNGEIISADSRQVYTGLDIGSGKDLEEYGDTPYHLIDVRLPEEKFTLFDWLKEAKSEVENIFKRGKLPIVVGGTGLYAKALAEGFSISKPQDQKANGYSREELNKKSLEELQNILKKLAINQENLDLNNPRRIIRAIEKSIEGSTTTKQKPNFKTLVLAIDLPRDELYKRIDRRVNVRFAKQRMLEEVKDLIERGVSPEWLKSLGLEYKFITQYIEGELKFDEMVQELKWKTHGYARRQLTWLRKMPNLIWIKNFNEARLKVEKFLI